jgi:hypothetical protein
MPKVSITKKGVGKPTLYKKAMKRHNVHLSDEHVKIAIALSGERKEISAGIRLALETVAKERGLTQRAPDNGDSVPSHAFSQPEFLSDLEGLS